MCGIAGFLTQSREHSQDDLAQWASRMACKLQHRGPNDAGAWADAKAGIALGHQRLSIIDLSAAGHQPMHSPCSRYTIVYNGEIYNHNELRDVLSREGATFRGHSDTEVLLAAISSYGIRATIEKLIGMFALAVWDARGHSLTLVRDRVGIKPLYYGRCGHTFLFGSELKALREHPECYAEIDRGVLALYMRHNYVPGPYSIYRSISKLPPGTMLTLTAAADQIPAPVPYWSLGDVVTNGLREPFSGSLDDATNTLSTLLTDAVKRRMVADVPLGAFLSGGIDSSVVASVMQANSSRPIQTFCIGFEEPTFNEAHYAKAVARHLGTEHREEIIAAKQAQEVIPKLPEIFDEPFADSSQIPTYLVALLARKHVTVSLSGDGGDELFGGYTRYLDTARYWERVARVPLSLRRGSSKFVRAATRLAGPSISANLKRRADFLSLASAADAYRFLNVHWQDSEQVVLGSEPSPSLFADDARWPTLADNRSRWMYVDTLTYLPDDILVKVDRATMATGLEGRVPLLDHRVVEFAWTLPMNYKIHAGRGKSVLRRVLERYVPRDLVERPKVGFGVPIDSWLRGPLKDWAASLLTEDRLRNDGYFRPEPIIRKWKEHLSGVCDWHYHLWDVLMFQSWLDHQTRSC